MSLFYQSQEIQIRGIGDGRSTLYNTRIVALDAHELIIRGRDSQGRLLPFPIGSRVEVYVVKPDAIYTLETTIADKRLSPEPTHVLERHDSAAKRMQRRQFFRVDTRVRLGLRYMKQDRDGCEYAPESGYSRNISAGGLMCLVHAPVRTGDQVQMQIHLPSDDEAINASGTIRRTHESTAGKRFARLAGIEFQDISEQDRSRLTRFLFRAQSRSRAFA